jgi:hypothetical protein
VSQALICAETEGAPVQLRAVDHANAGLELGVIGAFAASRVRPNAFVQIETAGP